MVGASVVEEDQLVPLLLQQQHAKQTTSFEVTVRCLSGDEFKVQLDAEIVAGKGPLFHLREEVENRKGVKPHNQVIFLVESQTGSASPRLKGNEKGSRPLEKEDGSLAGSCVVVLSVKPPAEFQWDIASPLIVDTNSLIAPRKYYSLSGPEGSVATKVDNDRSYETCLMTGGPAISDNTGIRMISFKPLRGMHVFMGVVRDGVPCNGADAIQWHRASTSGWFMFKLDGGLCGNGKQFGSPCGGIYDGQILTLRLDTGLGSLSFFRDGKPHGPGYTSGVKGPLRWAVTMADKDDAVQIVSSTPPDWNLQ
jgi:hypothetical protein